MAFFIASSTSSCILRSPSRALRHRKSFGWRSRRVGSSGSFPSSSWMTNLRKRWTLSESGLRFLRMSMIDSTAYRIRTTSRTAVIRSFSRRQGVCCLVPRPMRQLVGVALDPDDRCGPVCWKVHPVAAAGVPGVGVEGRSVNSFCSGPYCRCMDLRLCRASCSEILSESPLSLALPCLEDVLLQEREPARGEAMVS
eukprot:tig00000093_g3605.t1